MNRDAAWDVRAGRKPDVLIAVPNISEGRRHAEVRFVARSQSLLSQHSDTDHNRSVLTFGSVPAQIIDASFALVKRAMTVLDLRRQSGVHPRFGVVDVLPLIPYFAEERLALEAAEDLTRRIKELGIPVHHYGRAHPHNRSLPELRRFLRNTSHATHPTAGVVCLGIRDPLVAVNVNFRGDLRAARMVARAVRAPEVRALGFELPSRGLVQVSMNLIEPLRVGPKAAFDQAFKLARERGLDLVDCEIVGLVPEPVMDQLGSLPLRKPARSIEQALAEKGLL